MTNSALLSLSLSFLSTGAVVPAQDSGVADFGHRLLAEVARDASGNVCLSPWSAAIALGMVRAGAGGDTAAQLDAALGVGGTDPVQALAALARAATLGEVRAGRRAKPAELLVANALWVAKAEPLLASFTQAMAEDFAAPPRLVDFTAAGARELVNDWVAEQTRDRIRDLLPEGMPARDSRLVLVNCVYLDAPWLSPFDSSATRPRPFTLANGERIEVPTMAKTAGLGYVATERVAVVTLPFAVPELSMLIVVPRGETTLAAAAAALRKEWSKLSASGGRTVHLELPRFTLTFGVELRGALAALGIRDLFDPARADLSGMASDVRLFASAVVQKTFVKVDERGAEAAAATGIVIAPTSAVVRPEEPTTVRADRPFLFAIRHARAGVLFLGQIVDPR